MNIEDFVFKHTTSLRVRYAETDKMGVVYNSNYFAYFEVGRTELMRNYGVPYTSLEKAGYILPVIETHAEFKNPALYDDILEIETNYRYKHSPIIRFEYNIFRADTTIAIGYTMHSFVNLKTLKPVKPPPALAEILGEYVRNFSEK